MHLTSGLALCLLLVMRAAPGEEWQVADGTAQPRLLWAAAVGCIDAPRDEIDGLTIDPEGNPVSSGVFRGQLDLGDTILSSRGEGDIFLAKHARDSGRLIWQRQIGGPGDDNTYDVASDAAGNIIISGWFSDSVDFGGEVLTSAGQVDAFIASYDGDGALRWARRYGGEGGDGGNEVAVTADGEIAVSAMSDGAFSVAGRSFAYGGGRRDAYALRFSPEGDLRWVCPFNGPGTERIRAVAIAADGSVALGFQYLEALAIPGTRLQAAGSWDGAIALLAADGSPRWLRGVASKRIDHTRGIGIAPDGAIYASGLLSAPGLIAGRRVTPTARSLDYLVRLDGQGRIGWLLTIDDENLSTGAEIEVDAGGVLLSALADGELSVRLDGNAETAVPAHGTAPTATLMAIGHDGGLRWLYRPTPLVGGRRDAALGDVLAVSRDGRYIAQALRFRGRLQLGEQIMTTPGDGDSALLLFERSQP